MKRSAVSFALLAAGAAIFGLVVQRRRDAAFRSNHPPPGKFVDLGGYRIHYRERGEGACTFVLEPGLGDYSGTWGALENALAEVGRVFVYDRAGLGWSDPSPHRRTAQQIATELHRVLAGAQVRKPYILVGHSLGGASQTLFAMNYPDEVVGLFLIEPSHKDQFVRLPPPPARMTILMAQVSRTAPFGLPQLLMNSSNPVTTQSKHIQTSGAEMRAALALAETWGDRPVALGNLPIYVLTAGDHQRVPGNSEMEKKATWEIWRSLHADLVAASSSEIRKHEVVAGASHYVHHSHAAVVIRAAREMANRIQTGAP